MSDGEFKFPDWQTRLQDLILEFDREKALEKMQQLETILSERLRRLQDGNDARDEKQAINDALSLMRIIERDRSAPVDRA